MSYEPIPGKKTWNCKFVFTCRKCGGQTIRLPDDPTDESPASCQTCGEEFGRFGDIKALSISIGQQELRKRGALGNSIEQQEPHNRGSTETTNPQNRRKWGALGVFVVLAIVAGILSSREIAQKMPAPAAPIAASVGKSSSCAEWAKAGITLKQCYDAPVSPPPPADNSTSSPVEHKQVSKNRPEPAAQIGPQHGLASGATSDHRNPNAESVDAATIMRVDPAEINRACKQRRTGSSEYVACIRLSALVSSIKALCGNGKQCIERELKRLAVDFGD